MKNIKIGFLPLYLKLYDDQYPDKRPQVEAFAEAICKEYEKRDIEVIAAPVCRIKHEFAEAVKDFEKSEVDAILTLHLAYSPSLESSDILAGTDLPIVILDTTPDLDFGFDQEAKAIIFNHGIHGVQDMCNLLIRNGKEFMIEAGHWQESDVIDRTLIHLKTCKLASVMRKSRVGIIGEPFSGMGDFAIDFDILKKTIGMEVISMEPGKFKELISGISEEMIEAEIQDDLKNFISGEYSQKSMHDTIATTLTVRKWLNEENLDAFTVNFLSITKASGIPVVPFLEASKAMARGTGYAGEGDVLTGALTRTLLEIFPESTFTETFCPDWKEDRIFLSHMGEVNLNVCSGKAVLQEKPFPFTDADNPVVATGCLKPGAAHFINLAPGPNETYTLIAAPVEVCDTQGKEAINSAIRGWFKPAMPIADFLKNYSLLGGTHHQVLSYNANEEILCEFAEKMNWKFQVIK